MKMYQFKNHDIVRSSPTHKKNYKSYKDDLKKDFQNRCAYCNTCDSIIQAPFEIDHFIPAKICRENSREDLLTDYKNLVYSCKKCNNAKGAQFKGDLSKEKPTNELFYDPVEIDYNSVFFRNEFGIICSDDEKGRKQIIHLKLYRLLYSLGWICEQTKNLISKLDIVIESSEDEQLKNHLLEVQNKLYKQHFLFINQFMIAYKDNS